MKRAVLKYFLIVVAIALIVCSIITSVCMGYYEKQQIQENMLYSLRVIDYSLDFSADLQPQIDRINPVILENNTRITLIDFSGTVLADTNMAAGTANNHLQREEIQQALANGYGATDRYSETLHQQMLYVSCRSEKADCIIRLSIPYDGVIALIQTMIPTVLFCMLIAFVISFFFAQNFSNSITKPLAEISSELLKLREPDHVLHFREYQYDELNHIVFSVGKLSDQVNKTVSSLRYEQNKMNYILDNLSEGFILLDEKQKVITLNQAAKRILNCINLSDGKNIVHYTQNPSILHGITQALSKEDVPVFDIRDTKEQIYSVYISRVQKGILNEDTSAIVILLIDVTGDRQAQQIRQDFFSNASHELKTPITSIQGFAELLGDNLVTNEEQKKEFLQRITNETRHMTNLINDILMISRLENKMIDEKIVPTSIYPIIKDAIHSLSPAAKQGNITVTWDCENLILQANPSQMTQLVSNLIGNAIKYNKEGGSVTISAKQINNFFVLCVTDTGIGIPPDYQQRVFERFFRVDKGRSRKMGGTGLGLAIVKHIVQFYHGSVELESTLNVGTSVTVRIPIK